MKSIVPDKETQIVNSINKKKLGQLKKRRELRKTKIFMSRIRLLLRLIFIVVFILLLVFIAKLPQWYINKNTFSVFSSESLEIEGNSIVSSKQIYEKLKNIKLPDKPVYLINTRPVEKKLYELMPIKKVFIRRYWFPGRIKITIEERTPVLSIAPTPKVTPIAVFTSDNGVVKIINRQYLPLPPSKETYKIITYDRFPLWKPSQVQYITQFAYYVETATNEKIEYIDIRNPDDVFIQLKNIRLRIGRINGSTTFANVDKIRSVLPEALKIRENIEYLDLRWDNVSIKLKNKTKEQADNKEKIEF